MRKTWKNIGVSAAAALLAFTISVNASPVFAANLQDIPVIGKITEVLTVRSYTEQDKDKTVTVNQPGINGGSFQGAIDINKEIEDAIRVYTEDAAVRIDDYKKAFIATGGTEEQFAEKNIKVNVDYEIKCSSPKYLSFAIYMNENWVSAYAQAKYYNLDATTGEAVTLEALLGQDYIEVANKYILEQIEIQNKANGSPIYYQDKNAFTTIKPDANFYINEAGNPVIVFDKYEIAAGAYGSPEFEIIK